MPNLSNIYLVHAQALSVLRVNGFKLWTHIGERVLGITLENAAPTPCQLLWRAHWVDRSVSASEERVISADAVREFMHENRALSTHPEKLQQNLSTTKEQ